MPFTTTSEFVELRPDVKLHVVRSSPATEKLTTGTTNVPTVVFLHFWGGSSSTWSPVNSLVASQYPTLALDFRGWGQSTGPEDKNAYSIAYLADDVEAVILHYHLQNIIIVGHSMGGKVAQAVAGRGSVVGLRGVVLIAPAPPTPFALPPEMREQQIHAYEAAESAEFVTRNVLSAGSLSDETVSATVGDMLRGNQWARPAWPAHVMAEDILELAKRINVPVSVVVADKDNVEPLARVEAEVCTNIKGATVKVLPDSGHLLPLEVPKLVADHLAEFIQRLE
ncbi:hypothetical protein ACO1O0_000125 [Amphichorda felina]